MRQYLETHKWIVIILCILVGIYFLWPIITDDGSKTPDSTPIMAEQVEQNVETSPGVLVYITGAVQSPGLYQLADHSTGNDAVKAAGGPLPYADIESVNLADSIHSGDHLHIAFNFYGNPEMLLRTQKININTASVQELDALPGIGPTMAKRIDEYRHTKGNFTTIEDIKHVKGIGDGLFKKIREKITV